MQWKWVLAQNWYFGINPFGNKTILFKTTHTIVEVLLDQEVIYQYGREENAPDFMKSPGSLWHFAEIPGDSAGKTL